MPKYVHYDNAEVLVGWKRIHRYLGVSIRTAHNWHKRHGFPVARLPDGRVGTSKSLIDQWLMARTETEGFYVDRMAHARAHVGRKQGLTSDTSGEHSDSLLEV